MSYTRTVFCSVPAWWVIYHTLFFYHCPRADTMSRFQSTKLSDNVQRDSEWRFGSRKDNLRSIISHATDGNQDEHRAVSDIVTLKYNLPLLTVFPYSIQCILHSVFCNRVIFLLLKHRRSHMVDAPAIDRHRQSNTLYIFTTVHTDAVDTFQLQPEEEESRWQARAEREWIRWCRWESTKHVTGNPGVR